MKECSEYDCQCGCRDCAQTDGVRGVHCWGHPRCHYGCYHTRIQRHRAQRDQMWIDGAYLGLVAT